MELWGAFLSALISMFIVMEKKPPTKRSRTFSRICLCQALLLFSDAMGFMFEGNPDFISHNIVLAANFLVYILGYVLMALFTLYLNAYFESGGRVSPLPLRCIFIISTLGILLTVLSQFNHMYYVVNADSVYVRGDMFWLSQVLGIAGLVVNAVFLFSYRKRLETREMLTLGLYIVLPVAAMTIQIFIYGLALLNLANTISIIVIFMCVHLDYVHQERKLSQKIIQQNEELVRERETLAQTRVDLMRSQIQPHFIYNTLSTIGELCLIDPPRAAEIVREFSQYLRGNFDELECNTPIRVTREIDHVKHYTAIENVRFPDMHFLYDLHALDFSLPPLTIQPLVENAVKHGLMGKETGGTVIIATWDTPKAHIVQVKDNGIGFDQNLPPAKRDRRHMGLDNISERLRIMCSGTLEIKSIPGHGTTATISIPKEIRK